MKKLKLDLDELTVESFDTQTRGAGEGTVLAHRPPWTEGWECETAGYTCDYGSCVGTCQSCEGTCAASCHGTCYEQTCAASCGGTCDNSCYGTCNNEWTCWGSVAPMVCCL